MASRERADVRTAGKAVAEVEGRSRTLDLNETLRVMSTWADVAGR
jgi:hypothetical protein